MKNDFMKKYDISTLQKDMDAFSITLSDKQIYQFITYYELLIHWNSFMNLTGITEYEDVIRKHFTDSLSLAAYMDLSVVHTVIDVGTGAGFPGIPLKIVFPYLEVTLLDSLKKRIGFLNEVISKLDLKEIKTLHGRAEDFAKSDRLRESYDLCVSRAVANLSTLSEYCLPFVKKEGMFAAYKSEKVKEELDSAEKTVKLLGGEISEKRDFLLPGSDLHRTIILIRKKKETPAKYPRKAGIPSREPLYFS